MIHSDMQTRVSTSLDGEWDFLIDPDESGEQRGLQNPTTDWPDDATETITVPHSWQETEDYREYTGTAWYRTTVEHNGAGERTFLRFGAVDYDATVYVNGNDVGGNHDGYLPFEVEVTDVIESGKNIIVVRVIDPEDIKEIPHGKQGEPWYTRVSGIWQSVTLESRPATFVSSVRATPNLDDDSVTVEIETDGETKDEATVTVSDGESDMATATCELSDGWGECDLSIPNADYWTPETPVLYNLTVELQADGKTVDVHEDYFGMRSFETDDDRFYLNGEPFYIRGALEQAYYPDTLYRPFDDDLYEYEIRTAKDLGFNLLRKHIKPAHPDFIEAADRLGILVWEEPANPGIYTERSKREVRDQLRGMIDRDYNHPSVVIWSIYNEEWGIGGPYEDYEGLWTDEEKQEYLTDLFYETKEWDPTRLVCDNSGWAHVATEINDYHSYFVSPDRAAAWSDYLDHIIENPADNYGVTNTDPDDAALVISEFGTWGFPDLPKLRAHYNGDPSWFSHDFLDDPLKCPEGVDDRFEETNIPDALGDYDELARVWQARELASVKDVIEQMRRRDEVAGYVITEFSDIEWEFNGILDYLRDEKRFADEFAAINDAILVSLEPELHVVHAGENVDVSVTIVNDTSDSIEGELRWEAFEQEGIRSMTVDGFGMVTLDDPLTISAPAVEDTQTGSLDVRFDTATETVTNSEPLTVVSPEPAPDITLYVENEQLKDKLTDNGAEIVADSESADVAIVSSAKALDSQASDTSVLILPDEDGHMDDRGPFEYRDLPESESWNLVASLLYHDSDLLNGLAPGNRPAWAFEGLYPYDVVSNVEKDKDELHVGYVEGWLANWGSALLIRDTPDNTVGVCTFRVTDGYDEHPTATVLVHRLVEKLT